MRALLAEVVSRRELDSAESIAEVLQYRAGQQLAQARLDREAEDFVYRSYGSRTPVSPLLPERVSEYVHALARQMDERAGHLAEQAAAAPPDWAERLGPVPDSPLARMEWTERAQAVAAYREQFGYASEGDAIGPRPGAGNPERRAAWDQAADALGIRSAERDMAGRTEGELANLIGAYRREEEWLPPNVDDQLRTSHIAARAAEGSVARLQVQFEAARHDDVQRVDLAERLGQAEALAAGMRERVQEFEDAAELRDAAVAGIADLYAEASAAREELRHRGVDSETLRREDTERAAEPEPSAAAQRREPEPVPVARDDSHERDAGDPRDDARHRDRAAAEALAALDDAGRVHIAGTRPDAFERAAGMYRAQRDAGRDDEEIVIVVEGSDREVDTVNALVQHVREQRGEIPDAGYDIRASDTEREWTLHEDDRVVFLQTHVPDAGHQRDVREGETGVILATDSDDDLAVVAMDRGDVVIVGLDSETPAPLLGLVDPGSDRVVFLHPYVRNTGTSSGGDAGHRRDTGEGETGVILAMDSERDFAVVAMDRGDVATVGLDSEAVAPPLGLAYAMHAGEDHGSDALVAIVLPSSGEPSAHSAYPELTSADLEAHVILDYETHGDNPVEELVSAWSRPALAEPGPEPAREPAQEPWVSPATNEPSRMPVEPELGEEPQTELAGTEAGELVTSSAGLYRAAEADQQENEARQSQQLHGDNNPAEELVSAWSPPEPGPELAAETVREPRVSPATSEPSRTPAGALGYEPQPETEAQPADTEAGELVTSSAGLYRAAEAEQRERAAREPRQPQEIAPRIVDPLAASRAEQDAALRRVEERRRARSGATPSLDHTKVWVEPTLAEEHAARTDPDVQQHETRRRRERDAQGLTEQKRWQAETERLEREMRQAGQAAALGAAKQLGDTMRRSGR